ncbi:MAG TPA: DoxX family protein [Gaiellaceae bacterium]|jgi:putative oxidoreductase|nr:DoxX family protein [Gaiellaceae bacterium]
MSYGLLLLRVVVGLTMSSHGAQKLFAWFDGPGLDGVKAMLGNFRFRLPALMALGLGLTEFGGGTLFALGFLTPLMALGIVVVMLNAIALVHFKNGFWSGKGGYEFNLVLLTVAVAVAATGPGRFSIDRALGWDDNLSGLWWGLGVLGAAAVVSGATLNLGRRRERLRHAAVT